MGDLVDLRSTWSQFEEPSHALTTINSVIPMHCYIILALDMQAYAEDVGNPFWEAAIQKE